MSQDLFATSVIPWFRDQEDKVANFIHRMTIPDDDHPATEMFRPATVQNATSQSIVPAAAERLIRWTDVHPNEIFWYGFQPWVSPAAGNFLDDAFNLRQFVDTNSPSIFVAAARYYRNARNILVRWRPCTTRLRFEYEIFAYGGIDVNAVLGDAHQYASRHEVTFPGGIRREFIRTAREYRGTQLVRIWDNPRFDNTLNPEGHVPALEALPDSIRRIPVPIIFFTERDGTVDPDGGAPTSVHRAADKEDMMHEDGVVDEDETLNVTPTPRLSVACVLHPTIAARAYFFCGNRYVVIDVNSGSATDTIVSGPKSIVANWPFLVKAGFGTVDAILTDSGSAFKQVMYFFCLEKYVRIDITPGMYLELPYYLSQHACSHWHAPARPYLGADDDDIFDGPRVIVDAWPSLKKAEFKTIDAVLTSPANNDEAYFFSGERYIRVKLNLGSCILILLEPMCSNGHLHYRHE